MEQDKQEEQKKGAEGNKLVKANITLGQIKIITGIFPFSFCKSRWVLIYHGQQGRKTQ